MTKFGFTPEKVVEIAKQQIEYRMLSAKARHRDAARPGVRTAGAQVALPSQPCT